MAPSSTERTKWWTKITRDLVLFTTGLALTIREGLTNGAERPSLYVLYAGMMGLGQVLRFAEARSREEGKP